MDFKSVVVDGVPYGKIGSERDRIPAESRLKRQRPIVTNVDFVDPGFFDQVEEG